MSTWIFLRGLTRESRHWGNFPSIFRAAIPDAEILALDLPGNGRLNRMTSPTRVGAMADYCRGELLARAIPPPYHILAMSLGAMVTVDWALKQPKEIAGCVLINTSLRPFNPLFQRLRPVNYPTLLKLALLGGGTAAGEKAILAMTSHLAVDAAAILASWRAYSRDRPVARRNALRQLLAAGRYIAPLERPTPRLLILASARDALVDPRCSRQLAWRWGAAHAEHPEAGHDLPLDDGAWVAMQVRRWLETSAGRRKLGVVDGQQAVQLRGAQDIE